MPLQGVSSPTSTATQGVQQSARTSRADGPFYDVDLADPPRPRASAGFSATAKASLEALGSKAGGVFASLSGKLSVAADKAFNLAEKAANGLLSGLKTMGREAKALFSQVSPRSASTPAAPSTSASAAGDPATEPKKLEEFKFPGDYLRDKQTSFPPGVNGQGAVYAQVKHMADDAVSKLTNPKSGADSSIKSATGTFLRASDQPSNVMARTGGADMQSTVVATLKQRLDGQGPLPLSAKHYDPELTGYPSLKGGSQTSSTGDAQSLSRKAVAATLVAITDIIGTPGDGPSIRQAASRVPQDFCNTVGIALRAIQNSDASGDIKGLMVKNTLADLFALRALNPMVVTAAATLKDQGVETGPDFRANVIEFSKFFQAIANGSERSDPLDQGVLAHLNEGVTLDDLHDSYTSFMNEVAARADGAVVNEAVRTGDAMIAAFNGMHPDLAKTLSHEETVAQAEWM